MSLSAVYRHWLLRSEKILWRLSAIASISPMKPSHLRDGKVNLVGGSASNPGYCKAGTTLVFGKFDIGFMVNLGLAGQEEQGHDENVMTRRRIGILVLSIALGTLPSPAAERKLDPAAWGSDHAGKAVPESITGDECLFCHRVKIGPAWPRNRHQSTIRNIDPEARTLLKSSKSHAPFAEMAEYVLGRTNQWRF